MADMRRIKIALTASFLLALALPAAAPAKLTEVGVIGVTNPATVPAAPAPLPGVSRTTGFQVKVATVHNPMASPPDLVRLTITLGKPNATQVKYSQRQRGRRSPKPRSPFCGPSPSPT